jgi:hypothetical protein
MLLFYFWTPPGSPDPAGAEAAPETNSEKGIRGVNRALQALRNNNTCAKALGAGNWSQAYDELNGAVEIGDVPLEFTSPTLTEKDDGAYTYSYSYTAAYARGDGTLQLNNVEALKDLTKLRVGTLKDGTPIYANVLTDFESSHSLKTGSMTSDLFWAIFELHELGHILNGLKSDKDKADLSSTNTDTVIKNCFKDLVK